MRRDELPELHYLTPVSNMASISKLGILSHFRAASVKGSVSIANSDVQNRRHTKTVPNGRRLHEYVNLYVNARSAMMYCQLGNMDKVCVIRVDSAVLDLPKVVITDRNAAADIARFAPSPSGLARIDKALTFARYWTHPGDPIAELDHKQRMCAEILVPDEIGLDFILGCHVSGTVGLTAVQRACNIPTIITRELFFL